MCSEFKSKYTKKWGMEDEYNPFLALCGVYFAADTKFRSFHTGWARSGHGG